MPVTKTAKRALRSSKHKESINKSILSLLERAVRAAKKAKTQDKIIKAISLADKAAKKHAIHKNKAARLKSQLTKLMPKSAGAKVSKAKKKKPSKK